MQFRYPQFVADRQCITVTSDEVRRSNARLQITGGVQSAGHIEGNSISTQRRQMAHMIRKVLDVLASHCTERVPRHTMAGQNPYSLNNRLV